MKLNQSIQHLHLPENFILPKDALRQMDVQRVSIMHYFNLVAIEELAGHYLPEDFDTKAFRVAPKSKGIINRQN